MVQQEFPPDAGRAAGEHRMSLNRNTPMPRGGGLERKARLQPGSPLERGTGLSRSPRKPARSVSSGEVPR